MTTKAKQILEELKAIRIDLDYLKTHIADVDMVLTDDDLESIKTAEKELKEGKTKRLI